MKTAIDIHDIDKRLASAKRLVAKNNPITKRNSELISKIEDYGFTISLTKKRNTKYVYSLRKLAEWLDKDFDARAASVYGKDSHTRNSRVHYSLHDCDTIS